MRSLIAAIVFVVASPLVAHAGGDSFLAEIVSLVPKDNDEYRLELIQYTAPYGIANEGSPARLIIHLRFNQRLFGRNPPDYASKAKYLEAIDSLKRQEAAGGRFLFGVMARGYAPIKGRKNEFQSDALSILEQHDGKKVVFSFTRSE